jgi:hypothetical protein
MNSLTYLIIPVSELSKVIFTDVSETSINTIRKSINLQKTFIKWDGETPSFVNDITDSEGPYNHSEILVILSTPEWMDPTPPTMVP